MCFQGEGCLESGSLEVSKHDVSSKLEPERRAVIRSESVCLLIVSALVIAEPESLRLQRTCSVTHQQSVFNSGKTQGNTKVSSGHMIGTILAGGAGTEAMLVPAQAPTLPFCLVLNVSPRILTKYMKDFLIFWVVNG